MVVRYEERGGRGRFVDGAHWANTGKPPVPRSPTLVSFGGGSNKTKSVIKPPHLLSSWFMVSLYPEFLDFRHCSYIFLTLYGGTGVDTVFFSVAEFNSDLIFES